ncbi:hypothetical protein CBOM_04496 [Ceraceosorus bombacis]|uniref:Uncharacterized protein n=1 Tax=Ceraceosorus bombacis TaxID=401625 RepID=A0A0P1BMU6_9BASI|nr:hypothetical protein CBOM_04496 [Ceraceosorus bombacis]
MSGSSGYWFAGQRGQHINSTRRFGEHRLAFTNARPRRVFFAPSRPSPVYSDKNLFARKRLLRIADEEPVLSSHDAREDAGS